MGTNNYITKNPGDIISADDPNQYKTGLIQSIVPRNASGIPTANAGDLGTTTFPFKQLHVTVGGNPIGHIIALHDFNGLIPTPQGYMKCNGDIVNETNYDALHGAGSWDLYIVSSVLEGKYTPNLSSNGYLTGTNATTQTGASALTLIGSNTINLQHSHTVNAHTHTIDHTHATAINAVGGGVVGVADEPFSGSSGSSSPGTNNALSTTQDNKPSSLEVEFWIKII